DPVDLPADVDHVQPADTVLAERVQAAAAEDRHRVRLRGAVGDGADGPGAAVAEGEDAAGEVVAEDVRAVERLAAVEDVAAAVDVPAGDGRVAVGPAVVVNREDHLGGGRRR